MSYDDVSSGLLVVTWMLFGAALMLIFVLACFCALDDGRFDKLLDLIYRERGKEDV